MSRRTRPNVPGGTFHITSRLLHGEPLFSPLLRTALVGYLRERVEVSDAALFAYAIMPNHLHLVVRQGEASISRFMQPFLRRVALLVQRCHGREGHVFERRFNARFCGDADHVRSAIVYNHLNPVRAGICPSPADYPWTSHGAWTGRAAAADRRPHPVACDVAIPLFALRDVPDPAGLRADYAAFEAWRQAVDRFRATAGADAALPLDLRPEPPIRGDLHWDRSLSAGAWEEERGLRRSGSRGSPHRVGDLQAIAEAVIGAGPPGLERAIVRSKLGGAPYVRARHEIIRRAASRGHRGIDIAAYLRISPSVVSDVIVSSRKRRLLGQV